VGDTGSGVIISSSFSSSSSGVGDALADGDEEGPGGVEELGIGTGDDNRSTTAEAGTKRSTSSTTLR